MSAPSWAVPGAKVNPAKVKRGEDRPGTVCACGDHAFAKLTRGYVTIVDPQDIGVFARKWGVSIHRGRVAAMRILWPEHTSQLLHRVIVTPPDGMVIDHINGNPLDNRRRNLRVCTVMQNSWNRGASRRKASGLPKGVFKKRERFAARIKRGDDHIYLGSWETPEEAAAAYAEAAERLHGEFARVG